MVKAQLGPGFLTAFDDERAAFAVESVPVTPQPPGGTWLERKRDLRKHLVRSQPEVLVLADPLACLKLTTPLISKPTRYAIGGHDQISVTETGQVADFFLKPQLNSKVPRALSKNVE